MLIELGRIGNPGVLVVDDEPQIVESVADLLRRDYHVFGTDDVEEALRLLVNQEIAILLTDQRMPKTTGAELLARAAGISPDTFRVLFTGYSDIQAVIQAVNEGRMYYYMAKPWDPKKLLAMVAGAARHHNLMVSNRKLLERLTQVTAKTSPATPAPAVKDEITLLEDANSTLNASLDTLVHSFEHLQTIQHLISRCMECGKIRTADANWEEIGMYLKKNKIFLSHGYCPECATKVMKEMGLDEDAESA
jgi:response regulator RpfG family c-di-GMP phosphodiesterase